MCRKTIITCVAILATNASLMAVPLPAPGSGNASPIDAGVIALAIAGVAVGTRRSLAKK